MCLNVDALRATRRRNKNENFQNYADQSRKINRFIDVFIKAGKITIPAHKLVLGCCSQFFERLFESPMKEHYDKIVEIRDFDENAVFGLVDYMYTGSITIDDSNVVDLLATANFLQMEEICQFCFDYLKTSISIDNWHTILATLCIYENNFVLKQLHQYISTNFSEISLSENFKLLSTKDLVSITENLNRSIVQEISIYKAIERWIQHDEIERKKELPNFLLLLDLQKFPCDFLEDVVAEDPLIKDNVDCVKAIMSAIKKQFKDMRQRRNNSKVISFAGDETHCKVAEVYNLSEKSSTVFPALPQQVYHPKALQLNEYLYCIGGNLDVIGNEVTPNVYQIDVTQYELQWQEGGHMNVARCLMGAAVFKNRLVVTGGLSNHRQRIQSSEMYTPALNKWQQISDLNCIRSGSELVECDGCLYALGGFDGTQFLSSMERLEHLFGDWENVEAMTCPRAKFAAVSCDREIYVIGGIQKDDFGKSVTMKSVEKYNPIQKSWTFVKDLNIERRSHAACVLNGRIFVVGGSNKDCDALKSIEYYNPTNNDWTIVGETDTKLVGHALLAL